MFAVSEVTEFCLTDTFAAACDDNHVVVMDVARFGRMRLGRCVTRNYGNVGCYTDVLFQVRQPQNDGQSYVISVLLFQQDVSYGELPKAMFASRRLF